MTKIYQAITRPTVYEKHGCLENIIQPLGSNLSSLDILVRNYAGVANISEF